MLSSFDIEDGFVVRVLVPVSVSVPAPAPLRQGFPLEPRSDLQGTVSAHQGACELTFPLPCWVPDSDIKV